MNARTAEYHRLCRELLEESRRVRIIERAVRAAEKALLPQAARQVAA